MVRDFCFPGAATSIEVWLRKNHIKWTNAQHSGESREYWASAHVVTIAFCHCLCLFIFPAPSLLPNDIFLAFLLGAQPSNMPSDRNIQAKCLCESSSLVPTYAVPLCEGESYQGSGSEMTSRSPVRQDTMCCHSFLAWDASGIPRRP